MSDLHGTPPRPGMRGQTLVLLRRPADAPELDDDEADRLQAAHLAFLADLRAPRRNSSGPFVEQHDPTLRGLCIYLVGVEQARVLAADDPLVRRGRLRADAFVWWSSSRDDDDDAPG